MNSENPAQPAIETIRSKGSELATATQDRAADALYEVQYQIRTRPWLFVGGALLVGVALAALLPRRQPEPRRLEAVRDWLKDAYGDVSSRLPDRADVQSAVDSLDLPGRIDCLRKKLHLG